MGPKDKAKISLEYSRARQLIGTVTRIPTLQFANNSDIAPLDLRGEDYFITEIKRRAHTRKNSASPTYSKV